MSRSLASLALCSTLALAACAAPFAARFPSPRRQPLPALAAGTPAQVPVTYASTQPGSGYVQGGYYEDPASAAPATTWDRPIPEPPGARTSPAAGCADTCDLARNGECDDGRQDAASDLCMPGTDCADCGG